MLACPICGLEGGFHDIIKHREHEVPREALKESGWVKEAHEQWQQEQAQRVAAEVQRQARLAAVAAEIDKDKQAWCLVFNDVGEPTGEWVLLTGSRSAGSSVMIKESVIKQPGE